MQVGGGSQAIGNGWNTGVTAWQVAVAGSETTGALAQQQGKRTEEGNVTLGIG